jgi:hypothetical protein
MAKNFESVMRKAIQGDLTKENFNLSSGSFIYILSPKY